MKQKTGPQNHKLLIKKKAKDLNRHFSKEYLQMTWTDLEIAILSEPSQTYKYHILLICGILKKKKGTNEPICKTESKVWKISVAGAINWETEIDMCTLLYIK